MDGNWLTAIMLGLMGRIVNVIAEGRKQTEVQLNTTIQIPEQTGRKRA